MGKEKQDIVVFGLKKPVTELVTNCNNWLQINPSLQVPVEAAFATVISAAKGVGFSLVYDTVLKTFVRDPLLQKPQALSYAVMMGAEAGIRCVIKKSRGKDDIQTRMAAGFCGGILHGLVRGNQPTGMIVHGVSFGLQNVLFLKVIEMAKGDEEDILYSETRGMLSTLGYDKFEKNFKKGMLTDLTLPLVTDSVLREVKIPPGARLRILDHIKRKEKENEGVGGDLAV